LDNNTARILQLAGDLEQCLHVADSIGADLAAIKILEALELVLALADRDGQKAIVYQKKVAKSEVRRL
jgi:hypothetical protein